MFWNSAATSSNIDTVLDDPLVTLNKVLEQEDVLQELRVLNKKLVEFLSRPESLNGMIDLLTCEPSQELPLLSQYKLPNIACEVLTSDNSFVEKITGDKAYLEKLCFFFRDRPVPINPLLASYVCRVLSEIISRKLEQNWYSYQLNLIQIMGYLQTEVGVLSWLLNHVDCSAVCDFFYKLMLNVEGPDMRNALYDWMIDKERIILRFMEKMTRQEVEDVHVNISRLVGDLLYAFQDEMITSSQDRAQDCDPFLVALRSHETITTLLNTMFAPDAICETSIMHGLDVVLSLLGVTRRSPRQSGRNDSLDEANDGVILSDLIKTELLSRMPTLLNLLQSPVDPNPLPMTYGMLENPVGLGRLAIAKFIAHLFTLNDDELNMGMINSGVLKQLLDLFWSNPWNNFLHRYVSKICISIAKSAQISPGSASYLIDMGVLSRIVSVFENKELKVGYRGHLAKVASAWGEAVAAETEDSNIIKELMHKLEETDKDFYTKWDIFYSNTLENYITNEQVLLAGVHPPASGVLISGPPLPFTESDSSLGGMQWLGYSAAASMMNIDFDTANSILNLSIGGAGDDSSPSSKAKSLFEMFCNEKTNSFDDEEEEDEENHEKSSHSLDLSSPESDSLEEEKWGDAEKKINSDMNLTFEEEGKGSTAAEGEEEEEEDIFSNIGNTPSIQPIPTVMGADPWANLDTSLTTEDNPWSNAVSSPPTDSSADFNKSLVDSASGVGTTVVTDADWATFDEVKVLEEGPPEDKV